MHCCPHVWDTRLPQLFSVALAAAAAAAAAMFSPFVIKQTQERSAAANRPLERRISHLHLVHLHLVRRRSTEPSRHLLAESQDVGVLEEDDLVTPDPYLLLNDL
ncbi:unnamed protein product [Merluccius merluccius]